jgi:arsenate reductase
VKSANITIYQKPTCTTCRQVYAILKESGIVIESVNYFVDPIPKAKLKELLKKMGISAKGLLRTKEAIYRKLKLGKKELKEDELVDLMVRYPELIQRPIVEKGEKAILARPAERIRGFL